LISLTAGDIRNATEAATSLLAALEDIAHGTATLADGETIADDLLTGLGIIDPAAAPWIALAEIMLSVGVTAVENGWVKPDLNPIADAQNETGR